MGKEGRSIGKKKAAKPSHCGSTANASAKSCHWPRESSYLGDMRRRGNHDNHDHRRTAVFQHRQSQHRDGADRAAGVVCIACRATTVGAWGMGEAAKAMDPYQRSEAASFGGCRCSSSFFAAVLLTRGRLPNARCAAIGLATMLNAPAK